MKNMIKKWFKLFDESDFNRALAVITRASDRDDFEHQLRTQLFRIKP